MNPVRLSAVESVHVCRLISVRSSTPVSENKRRTVSTASVLSRIESSIEYRRRREHNSTPQSLIFYNSLTSLTQRVQVKTLNLSVADTHPTNSYHSPN